MVAREYAALKQFRTLGEEQQQQVLEFMNALKSPP
jgi:hypothetical protein